MVTCVSRLGLAAALEALADKKTNTAELVDDGTRPVGLTKTKISEGW